MIKERALANAFAVALWARARSRAPWCRSGCGPLPRVFFFVFVKNGVGHCLSLAPERSAITSTACTLGSRVGVPCPRVDFLVREKRVVGHSFPVAPERLTIASTVCTLGLTKLVHSRRPWLMASGSRPLPPNSCCGHGFVDCLFLLFATAAAIGRTLSSGRSCCTSNISGDDWHTNDKQ